MGIKPYHSFPTAEGKEPKNSSEVVVSPAAENVAISYPEFTPEYYLTHAQFLTNAAKAKSQSTSPSSVPPTTVTTKPSISRTFSSIESIIVVLANMDRLARQHHMYDQCPIVDESLSTSSSSATPLTNVYSVDADPKVFEFLLSIIKTALNHLTKTQNSSTSPYSLMSYIIISCLRLMRVNLHAVVVAPRSIHQSFVDAGYADGGEALMK